MQHETWLWSCWLHIISDLAHVGGGKEVISEDETSLKDFQRKFWVEVDFNNFSLELFERDFQHQQPLVLTGLVLKWPATTEWTWEQLTDPKGQWWSCAMLPCCVFMMTLQCFFFLSWCVVDHYVSWAGLYTSQLVDLWIGNSKTSGVELLNLWAAKKKTCEESMAVFNSTSTSLSISPRTPRSGIWKSHTQNSQNIASGRTSRFAYLLFFKQFYWDVHHHFMDTGNDGPTARMRICSWRTLFCSHHSHMIVRLGRGPQWKSCQPKEVDFSTQVYVQIPFVKWFCDLTEISKVRVPTRGWPKTNSWKKLPASPQQGWILFVSRSAPCRQT